ncbi:MAG: PKD domain-containing protein [Pirellulales bacterium]
MRRTVTLGTVLLVALAGASEYVVSQAFNPPADHTVELGVPGFFTAGHKPGFQDPLNNDCVFCHGADLTGGFAPSCFTCHGEAWGVGGPPDSHTIEITGNSHTALGDADCLFCHRPHRSEESVRSRFLHAPGHLTAFENGCTLCHGPDLNGVNGFAPSCFTCHDQLWSDRLPNQPPVADPNGPYAGNMGSPVFFDGTGSFDVDGTIVAYDWDFGDLVAGSGPNPFHIYASAGLFDVTLTVTDDVGLTNTATTIVQITSLTNLPPVADPGGPYTGTPGETIDFDGSGSFDPDGSIFFYLWDFGDGNVGAGAQTTHTYEALGTYTVTLTVTDTAGAMTSETTTAEISAGGSSPPLGGSWMVRLPAVSGADFELRIDEYFGILRVEETFTNGEFSFGIGLAFDDSIAWIDATGALFVGTVDRDAGTMMGIVFNFRGSGTIWFAEQL